MVCLSNDSGSNPGEGVVYEPMKKYEANLEKKEEEAVIEHNGKIVHVKYLHEPNVVGPRSEYTGLPIWVGLTTASTNVDGGTQIDVLAKCWMNEPFQYSQARVVSTGRLLKKLGLPTNLAEKVKEL